MMRGTIYVFITFLLLGASLWVPDAQVRAQVPAQVPAQSVSDTDPSAIQAKLDAAAAQKAAGNNIPSSGRLETPAADTKTYDGIMSMLMGIFAWLVGAAAILLDSAVYYTVVTMGNYINSLSAVGTAWHILRDIGNIALIFGFIAIGIGLIVGWEFYGGGTKMLPTLLIAAVALNFSLFVSEAVIDVGNLFATQFYTQINGGAPAGQKSFVNGGVNTEGISNKIMAQVGLQSIYNVNFAQNKIVFKGGNMWIVGFMSILLFIIAAFVMFSLAFILIARFVYLIFLIITSPIGFAGYAIPKLEGYAKKWWKSLFEQTITAPVLLLLLYVALLVITSPAFLTGLGVETPGDAFLSWLGGGATGQLASMLLSFLVAMGLLLGVVIASKELSAFGASTATKWGSKLSFGVTAGALGIAGRNTLGWAGTRWGNSIRATKFGSTRTGRLVALGLDRTGKSTFDYRNTTPVKSLGSLGFVKNAGLDLSGGTKTNFADTEKKAVEDRVKYGKSLRQTTTDKAAMEAEEENARRKEQAIKDAKEENKGDVERMKQRHQANLDQMRERFENDNTSLNRRVREAQEALDVAANNHKVNPNLNNQRALAYANENLNTQKDALKSVLADQNKQIKTEQEKHSGQQAEVDALHKEKVKALEEEIKGHKAAAAAAKRAPQERYAANLQFGTAVLRKRNEIARETLLKEVKKSKSEQTMDNIKKLIEKSDEEGGDKKGEKKEKEEEAEEKKP